MARGKPEPDETVEDEDVSRYALPDEELAAAARRYMLSQFSDGEGSPEEFRMKNEILGRTALAGMAERELASSRA